MTGPGARLLALIVLFSAFRYLHDLAKLAIESSFVDFGSYYTYATLIGRGLNPLDPEAVAQVDRALGIRRAGTLAPYPVLFYIALQPLTLLPFSLAAGAWLAANQACLFGALSLWLRRVTAVAPVGIAATLFVVLNYQPLFEDFAVGQVNVILLLLVTLAWWAVRADRPWIAAAALAATLNVKVHYALLLPLLWWIGHARVCWRAIALAGAGLGISLIIWGPAFHLEYARTILSMPESHQIWTLNFSPRATLLRLFGGAGGARTVAVVLSLGLSALIVVLVGRALPRAVPARSWAFDWAWGLGLVAMPLLSPLTEEHHLVLLLLPLTLLLLREVDDPSLRRSGLLLAASVLLLANRYSLERFPLFHQGWLSLLLAGKLLGIACLFWCLLRRLRTESLREP